MRFLVYLQHELQKKHFLDLICRAVPHDGHVCHDVLDRRSWIS